MKITVTFSTIDNPGEYLTCDYDSIAAALGDDGLKCLFKEGAIKTCKISRTRDGKRLAGLAFMTWDRFAEALEPYAKR